MKEKHSAVLTKWTVLFRAKGSGRKQRKKRFMADDSFVAAKALALTKIGKNMYEGLYKWSDYDFAYAIEKARRKLDRKRLGREERALKIRDHKLKSKAKAELQVCFDEEKCFEEMLNKQSEIENRQ